MILPANIPYGLSVSFPASGLFVGVKIFKTTSGSPVQVTGLPGMVNNILPMPNVLVSNTYAVNFTGAPFQNYLFLFDVYTDDTYTAVNGAYAEQSRSGYSSVQSPLLVQGLRVMVGCENQANQKPVVIAQNSDGNIVLSFFNEWNQELDVTQATAMLLSFLEADGLTTLAIAGSLVAGTINQIIVQLTAGQMALLPQGENDGAVSFTLSALPYVINLYDCLRVLPPIV
jgi:hypothetical protein